MSKSGAPSAAADELRSAGKLSGERSSNPEVQVALLTSRINELRQQPRGPDAVSNRQRPGLVKLVNERKRLLAHLKQADAERYRALVRKLGLRPMAATSGGADPELAGVVERAVGPVRLGTVVTVNSFAGIAQVLESRTGRPFAVSRRFVDPAVFDTLKVGVLVRFRDNGHNVAAVVRLR